LDQSSHREDVQFPFGADILPSPVKKTWAAVVSDPLGSTDGGKISNAVSTAAVGCGDSSRGVSASDGTKYRGLLMMAIHRATAVVTSALLGLGGSMEDISKSQSIVSPRPLSERE